MTIKTDVMDSLREWRRVALINVVMSVFVGLNSAVLIRQEEHIPTGEFQIKD
jgi:hypothetical protein